jgi:hypothetical protein
LTPELGAARYDFVPILTKLFDKLRSNESGTADYDNFHDSPSFRPENFPSYPHTRGPNSLWARDNADPLLSNDV